MVTVFSKKPAISLKRGVLYWFIDIVRVTTAEKLLHFQVALSMQPLESVVDISTALVSYGCHIHAGGISPLHYAVSCNSSSIVAALLSARLRFPDTVSEALSTVDDDTGYAPLHTAVHCGYFNCCEMLIDAGADVNAVCRDMFGESVVTPLELAVVTRNKDIVQLLLQSPSCQVDKVGSRNATALLHATSRGATIIS